ncbi:response regulator [Halomicronema sp. CCY15110]|uniref:response regulator n=1 Tax=Halomicronema sp. CCY15110 TaxID=2767773 RepID=UPI00195172FD|nr:response regulator [Halomicronema sp. CCY15110]
MTIDPYKMLLIDDDPNDIELVQLAIQDFTFIQTLDVLTDGAQALEYLIGDQNRLPVSPLPQFVLMDLKLPKLTGIEVLQAIRQDRRTRTLPVVIMTSSSEDCDLRDCYDLGVNSYVVKPLDFHQFQEFVKLVGSYWMTINSPFSVLTS